jgi:hypothetical protein
MSLYLARGQRSNDVVALQHELNQTQPTEHQLEPDGIFGPNTEASVRRWQHRNGLKLDGIAGPQTLGSLFVGADVECRALLSVGRSTTPGTKLPPGVRYGPGSPFPRRIPDTGGRKLGEPPTVSLGPAGYHIRLHEAKSFWQARQEALRRWCELACPKPEAVIPTIPPLSRFLPEEPIHPPPCPVGVPICVLPPGERLKSSNPFVARAEFGSGFVGRRTFEFSYKGKLVIGKRFGVAVGGKQVFSQGDGKWDQKSGLHLQWEVKPFYIMKEQWYRLGKVGFSVAPSLINSYTVFNLTGDPYHKFSMGALIRPELTYRMGKHFFAGLGMDVGGMFYWQATPKDFTMGWNPVVNLHGFVEVRF